MKKSAALFFILFAIVLTSYSQRTISGSITDEFSTPLIGVNILAKDFISGTTTDNNGDYTLTIPEGTRFLMFRYIGFAERTVEIRNQDTLNIVMRLKSSFLEEVIITGTPIGTPTNKLGFAVDKINEEQLEEVPAVNAGLSLQARVPGVMVISPEGLPGSNPSIRIRGVNNLFGEQSAPLIIVDGIPLQEPSNITDINSEDIKSLEVIKGAAATSIYGSRAGSGVINITTKRGARQDGKTDIILRNEFGFSNLAKRVDINDHHHYMVNPDGSVNYNVVDPDQIADNEFPVHYDHFSMLFDPGHYMTNSLSIGSSSGATNYFLSLNNTMQSGIIFSKEGYKRQSLRANIDHRITKALKLKFSNYYAQSTRDDPAIIGNWGSFYRLLYLPPEVDLLSPNEEDGSPYNWDAAREATPFTEVNPLYLMANQQSEQNTERFSSSLGLQIDLSSFLDLQASYSIDRRTTQFEDFIDKGYLASNFPFEPINDGRYIRSNSKRSYQTANAKLTYNQRFDDFNLVSQTAIIFEDDDSEYFDVTGRDFRFSGLHTLDNSGLFNSGIPGDPSINRTEVGSRDLKIKSLNYYLTGKMDWRDKWIVDGLIRFDGSSLFGSNNRWNTYFRTSLAYRLSEDFVLPNVQELKIRASYGTAGNRPGFNYRFETLSSDAEKLTLGNEDLKPSLQKEIELGIDTRLWNRVNASFTYAISKTSNLFFDVPLPAAAGGFQRQWQNIDAEIKASSVELSLGIDIIKQKDYSFSTNFSFDRIIQTLSKWDRPPVYGYYPYIEGESITAIWIRKFAKSEDDLFSHQLEGRSFVVNSEGWLVDSETIGTIDERPILVEDEEGNTRFLQGTSDPDFNLGLELNSNWKRLRIHALLHWQQGSKVYNWTKYRIFRDWRSGDIDQSGKPDQDKIAVQFYSEFYRGGFSNYFLEDASYLKLREVGISYELDPESLGSIGNVIKGLKFSIIGRNLLTITNYSGYDPDVGGWQADETLDATTLKWEGFNYPNYRTISGSFTITF